MSSIVNKIKEAVHGDKHTSSSEPTGSHGPHDSRAANAADPRVDSDRDGRATHGTTGTSGLGSSTHTGTTGAYGSNTTGTTGLTGSSGDNYTGTGISGAPGGTGAYGSTNAGPHSSNLANKADPRVDSDRDGRATHGTHGSSGLGSSTHGTHGTSGLGSSGLGSSTHGATGTGYGSSNAGPHSSNLANKVDPRVDSDRDGRATHGTTGGIGSTHGTAAGYGTGQYGEVGSATGANRSGEYGSSTTGYGSSTTGYGSSNAGPHSSNLANKADPRVDSDRDGRATHGTHGTHGTSGLGSSGLGSSTHNTTGTGYGSHTGAGVGGIGSSNPGPAPNTAGPHKQDFLNKADPRVDSDRDGSKTLGQDKTYATQDHTSSTYNKDPTDAAQVPPSVLAKHIGEPSLEHDSHDHDRARRNSRATHQESHVGL